MEDSAGWLFGKTATQGAYSSIQYYSPTHSARLGIVSGPNKASYSSMRQGVSVPMADIVRLRLQVYPISQPLDTGDLQEIQILDSDGASLRRIWSNITNETAWREITFDISEFKGQTIFVYINVMNNGSGGVTALYVDDVFLETCSYGSLITTPIITLSPFTPTPTPIVVTNTPTPTPNIVTATPTATPNVVTATPTPIVVTNTPTPTATLFVVTATPTPIVVTNTPTPTPTLNIVTATPTPIVVTNTPTPTPTGPIVVTNTPTPTPTGPIVVTNTPTGSVVTATPTTSTSPPPPTATYTPVPPSPDGSCKECIRNGLFEKWGSWKFGETVLKGGYVGDRYVSPSRSLLLGNANYNRPNYNSYSSVRQRVTLPKKGYKSAFLEFWHYTISNEEAGDYQELVILDGNTGRTLEVLWRVNRNDQTWQLERFDMTRYLGKSIYIYFNVRNRGGSGRAAMYIDDVSLRICPRSSGTPQVKPTQSPFPAHTPTPTPSATPTPTSAPISGSGLVVTATPTGVATVSAVAQVTITAAATVVSVGTPTAGTTPTPFTPAPPSLTPEGGEKTSGSLLRRIFGQPVKCLLVLVVIAILIFVIRLTLILIRKDEEIP